jgi:hypothetical protein
MSRVIWEATKNYSIEGAEIFCFRIIKSVLDELYYHPPLSSEMHRDQIIRQKLKALREKYENLKNGSIPGYSDPYVRFAYLYCYVASHANVLCQLIDSSSELSSAFDVSNINVACIGGGPGSDLLGLLKFIQLRDKPAKLRCGIYDREEGWRDSLRNICNKIDPSSPISPYFRLMDVTDSATWMEQTELWEADLFTFSFFMSEIPQVRDKVNVFFDQLFKKAKTGALFLFVDNSSGTAHLWFDILVQRYNISGNDFRIEFLKKPEDKRLFTIERGEQKKDMEPYYSKFSEFGEPKLLSHTYYRICRKVREY